MQPGEAFPVHKVCEKYIRELGRGHQTEEKDHERVRCEERKEREKEYFDRMYSIIHRTKDECNMLMEKRRVERLAVQVDSKQPIENHGTELAEYILSQLDPTAMTRTKINKSGYRKILRKGDELWNQLDKMNPKDVEVLLTERIVEKDKKAIEHISNQIKRGAVQSLILKDIKSHVRNDIRSTEKAMKMLNDRNRAPFEWLPPRLNHLKKSVETTEKPSSVLKSISSKHIGFNADPGKSISLSSHRRADSGFNQPSVSTHMDEGNATKPCPLISANRREVAPTPDDYHRRIGSGEFEQGTSNLTSVRLNYSPRLSKGADEGKSQNLLRSGDSESKLVRQPSVSKVTAQVTRDGSNDNLISRLGKRMVSGIDPDVSRLSGSGVDGPSKTSSRLPKVIDRFNMGVKPSQQSISSSIVDPSKLNKVPDYVNTFNRKEMYKYLFQPKRLATENYSLQQSEQELLELHKQAEESLGVQLDVAKNNDFSGLISHSVSGAAMFADNPYCNTFVRHTDKIMSKKHALLNSSAVEMKDPSVSMDHSVREGRSYSKASSFAIESVKRLKKGPCFPADPKVGGFQELNGQKVILKVNLRYSERNLESLRILWPITR